MSALGRRFRGRRRGPRLPRKRARAPAKVRMVKPRCLTRLETRIEESNSSASGRVRRKPDDVGTRNESEGGSQGLLRWDGAWHQMKRAQHHRPILNALICASDELDLIDLRQSTAVGTRKVVSFAWIV